MKRTLTILLVIVVVTGQYNETIGKKLYHMSVAAYCNDKAVANWSCMLCKNAPYQIQNVQTLRNSTGQLLGYIATSKELNAILITFRGTLPWLIENDLADMDYILTKYPLCQDCYVHQGIYKAYMEMNTQILKLSTEYQQKYGYQNIIVSGHSLGATLATFCVASLLSNNHKVSMAYLFASFRAGNPNFARWLQKLFEAQQLENRWISRITHHRDIVPHLPPVTAGYLHPTKEIFYDGNVQKGYKVCNDQNGEDQQCSAQYTDVLSVMDHVTYYDWDIIPDLMMCQ